jgi:hypothetical protein
MFKTLALWCYNFLLWLYTFVVDQVPMAIGGDRPASADK